jgi:hypothetical protein
MKTTSFILIILAFTLISKKTTCQTKITKQFSNYTITIPSGWKESKKQS